MSEARRLPPSYLQRGPNNTGLRCFASRMEPPLVAKKKNPRRLADHREDRANSHGGGEIESDQSYGNSEVEEVAIRERAELGLQLVSRDVHGVFVAHRRYRKKIVPDCEG